MKTIGSICFTAEGVANPEALEYIKNNQIDSVVLFGDGTQEALVHMSEFDTKSLPTHVKRVGVGRTPIYEMRVHNADGTPSSPSYFYDRDVQIRWICTKVCAPHMEIHVCDISSTSCTQVLLDKDSTADICYVGYKFWSLLQVVESRFVFPAVMLDALSKFTYFLTPKTMDVYKLRKLTNVESLNYSHDSDILSFSIRDDIFTIKMSVLNETYGNIILPYLRKIGGRKLRISVTVKDFPNLNGTKDNLTISSLGNLVDDMRLGCSQKNVCVSTPIEASDLILFAKKVKIDDETCIWLDETKTVSDIIWSKPMEFNRGHHIDDDYCSRVDLSNFS